MPGRSLTTEPSRRRPRNGTAAWSVALSVLGCVLVGLWSLWWVKNFRHDRLTYSQYVAFPALPFLAGDFRVHIDHTARVIAAGDSPYTAAVGERPDADVCALLPYPPLVPRLFAWVSLTTPRVASDLWIVASAGLFVAAIGAVARTRRALGLVEVPTPLLLALFLFSLPVLFCLERGQGDPLVIGLVLLAIALLRRTSRRHDVLAGLLLATAIWFKFYPGLLLIAVVTLRRWTCLAGVIGGGLVIGLADLPGVLRALHNTQQVADWFWRDPTHFPTMHSLSLVWRVFVPSLAHQPGQRPWAMLGSLAVVLPVLVGVSLRLRRVPHVERLHVPWCFWLVAAGTFVPPIANDYNLICLPLAGLAVWDRRDPAAVHIALGFLTLALVPFPLEIGGLERFGFKLAGLLAVGGCLLVRARVLSVAGTAAGHEAVRGPHWSSQQARAQA